MPISLYMDVHIPRAVTEQLRRRGVDVLAVIEDGQRRSDDDSLLERASQLERVMFTQDVGFRLLAEAWQRQGRPFAGLLFARQRGTSIGQLVNDLELIAKASTPQDFVGFVQYLPL